MNRRTLLRHFYGVLHAAAFTGAGWLMGANALGMQMTPKPSPDPTCTCGLGWDQPTCNYYNVGGCLCARWDCFKWGKVDTCDYCDTQCTVVQCGCVNCPH
jgi:hypothetical protein